MQTENCTRVILFVMCGNDRKSIMCVPAILSLHLKIFMWTATKNNCTRHSNIIILQQWIPWHWQLYHVNCMHYIKFSCHTLSHSPSHSLARSTSSSSQLQALNKYEHFYLTSWAFKIVHFSFTHIHTIWCDTWKGCINLLLDILMNFPSNNNFKFLFWTISRKNLMNSPNLIN